MIEATYQIYLDALSGLSINQIDSTALCKIAGSNIVSTRRLLSPSQATAGQDRRSLREFRRLSILHLEMC